MAEDIEKEAGIATASGGNLAPLDNETSDESSPASPTEPTPAKYAARPACFKSTFQEVLFVLTATMAVGTSSFIIGSTTVITNLIAEDLKMTTAELTWVTAANSLSSGSFLLLFARLADLFGKRSMFITSLFLFSILCLGSGFARTPITLDILMGLVGLTTASAVPPAQGMLGVIYARPSKRKNAAFACFSAGNPLGFVAGMVAGGVAAGVAGWRGAFWFLAIVYAGFTIVAIFNVPKDPSAKEKWEGWETVGKLDVVGNLLALAGIGLFSSALSLGSDASQGWRTPYVLVLLILGVLFMVVFPFWENYCKKPLIPLYIFKDRNFSLLLTILLLGFTAFPIAGFWVSLYFQRVWHASALQTAVHMLPMAIMGTLVNVVAAFILHIVSNKIIMTAGAAAYMIAFLCYALNKTAFSYWALLFPGLCVCVVGADFEFNVVNMYVLSSLPASHQSIASGLFQTVTKLCVTLGFGISTALFDHVSKNPSKRGYHAGDPIEPYAATFWFSVAVSAAGLMLCPLLTVGTQGHHEEGTGAEEGALGNANANGEKPGSGSAQGEAEGIYSNSGRSMKMVDPSGTRESSATVSVIDKAKEKEKSDKGIE